MKSFKNFIRGYRGTEILNVCNGISCSLRDVIEQFKESYENYKKEYSSKNV